MSPFPPNTLLGPAFVGIVLVQIDFDPAEAGTLGGNMRFSTFIAAAAALFAIASAPAHAGLVGGGTNTVSVNYWFPSASGSAQ